MGLLDLELVAPETVGVDPEKLDLFRRRVQLEVECGYLPSAQIAVARHGRLVAFETFGDATNESRYILQSVGRTVVASAVWKLLGEGMLALDERVGDIIPEFATNGKEVVTVEQVLTHRAGFPFAPLGYPKMLDHAKRLEAMSKWRLDWEPGTRFQYHLTAAAWVIAELVERRTGMTFFDYLRAEIVEPLGLGFMLPVPADQYHEVLAVPTAIDRVSDDQKVDPWGPWYLADPEVLAGGEPSHSLVGTAADMAMLFQALFHTNVWPDGIVERATQIYGAEAAWGDKLYGGSDEVTCMALFCVVRGPYGNSFAPRTGSERTFGNGGAPFQLAFMDPDAGTSFAFLTNGYPMAGYDYTAYGDNLRISIAALGNDLVGR